MILPHSLIMKRNRALFARVFMLLILAVCHANTPMRGDGLVFRGGAEGPFTQIVKAVKEARRHLAAAAVARSVSIFAMYPVDTLKTRSQMGQENIFRLAGLYNGVGGSLFGQVPYGVLTFGSYEMYKKSLLEKFGGVPPPLLYAIAAVLGDVTGSGWLCPSEVVKQKLQAGVYSSTGEAVRSIWKTKGIAGLYEGYFGGLARDVPFRVAQLTSYEVTKNLYLKMKRRRLEKAASRSGTRFVEEQLELSPIDTAACGAIAGTFSAAITCPLDRIKTMLQVDSAANGGNVIGCASKILREEGIGGLLQGIGPRVVYIAPSVVIFFIAYEQVQQRLAHRTVSSHKD